MKPALRFLAAVCAMVMLAGLPAKGSSAPDVNGFGAFNVAGMPPALYRQAVSAVWEQVQGSASDEKTYLDYDLNTLWAYAHIEQKLINMAREQDVRLFKIGLSQQGRALYGVEVGRGEKIILLTGGIHARETASTGFIMKMLNGLIEGAKTDAKLGKLLREYKIAAIPCINPDGREGIRIGELPISAKYNAQKIDINRNFPSVNAGQIKKGRGNGPLAVVEVPGNSYSGSYFGEAAETRAVMNWLEYYILRQNAIAHLDLHQQGRVIYRGKVWDQSQRKRRTDALSSGIQKLLGYGALKEEPELRGEGGSATDYATGLAAGFVFSSTYGRFGMKIGREAYPYIFFEALGGKLHYAVANKNLRSFVIEVGGRDSLGFGRTARAAQEREYYEHNFDKLLPMIMQDK